jgi:hypothetical protein
MPQFRDSEHYYGSGIKMGGSKRTTQQNEEIEGGS